jgi:hypothetical protein
VGGGGRGARPLFTLREIRGLKMFEKGTVGGNFGQRLK